MCGGGGRTSDACGMLYSLWAVCALALATPARGQHTGPHVVTLRLGSSVRGQSSQARGTRRPVVEFLGVPYAEPPVGKMRFRKPVSKAPWNHVWNATAPPPACPQTPDTHFGDFPGATMWNPNANVSEDCLYLNVWVPGTHVDAKKRRTVMVWIYGGGFYSGTSTLGVYDSRILATEEDVIIVSMNYRVTIFGFLYLAEPVAPGNMGLWDQRLALQWVHDNIVFFGGDPDSVTIFGESAGGASVTMHVVSPHSEPYFRRAATQSGSATAPWALEAPEIMFHRAYKVGEKLNCNAGSHADRNTWNSTVLMECLLAAPWRRLLAAEMVLSVEFCDFPWIPVVDGDFLSEHPLHALQRGNFKRSADILLGSNREEANYFIVYQLQKLYSTENFFTRSEFVTDDKQWAHGAIQLLPKAFQRNPLMRNAILHEYRDWSLPPTAFGRQDALDKMCGDYLFLCNVNEFAQYVADHGAQVYYYYFTHRASEQKWPKWMGVLHGYEIMFVFGEPLNTEDYSYNNAEKQLSRRMMKYWANFAKTGNPSKNPDGTYLPDPWPRYDRDSQKYFTLAVNSTEVGQGPRRRQCAFWKEYVPLLYKHTVNLTHQNMQGPVNPLLQRPENPDGDKTNKCPTVNSSISLERISCLHIIFTILWTLLRL